MEKQALLNTYVNNVDMSETICAIEEMIASKNKSYIVAINVDAVSYTHLDVYKRQPEGDVRRMIEAIDNIASGDFNEIDATDFNNPLYADRCV